MKMVRIISLLILFVYRVNAQELSISDLQNICNKSSWEQVNQYLENKGWEYYDSEKGDSYEYNTITWSYNRSYGDVAQAWFYLFTYDSSPSKILYIVFDKSAYSLVKNGLNSRKYKLMESDIEDDHITSNYANSEFILQIVTGNRKSNDNEFASETVTAYDFLLIKKSGIYDPENGEKILYWEGSYQKKIEYSLKNGELHGDLIAYYPNGKVKKKGKYLNGKENGYFKEYDENGDLAITYSMKGGEFNGWVTTYEHNKKTEEKEYKNGRLNGDYHQYLYDDSGVLKLIQDGKYRNEQKSGRWEIFLVLNNRKDRVLKSIPYENDQENGRFMESQGDSVIFGTFRKGVLHGDYKIYTDLTKLTLGGFVNTDSTDLLLTCKGRYSNGMKSDRWSFYSFSGELIKTGSYKSGERSGEWLYYYENILDEDGSLMPYSGKLFMKENYKNGLKEGTVTIYSSLQVEKYPCKKNEVPDDEGLCSRFVYEEFYQNIYFKKGEPHGPFLMKDSSGKIIMQGTFEFGEKTGEWLESFLAPTAENDKIRVFERGKYSQGKRTGRWSQFVVEFSPFTISNYSEGLLQGELINYNSNGKPSELKFFEKGNLKRLEIYDEAGREVTHKYEILKETNNNLKVKRTRYNNENIISQVFTMEKDEPELNHEFFEFYFLNKLANIDGVIPDGEYSYMDPTGTILIEGDLKGDQKIGIWLFNFPDQNVQVQIEYKDNVPGMEKYMVLNEGKIFSGTFVYTDEENNIKEFRKVKNGFRHGKTVYMNENGKKIKTEKYKNGILK